MSKQIRWFQSASHHDDSLPSDITLLDLAQTLRADGLTWPQVAEVIHTTMNAAKGAAQRNGLTEKHKPQPKPGRPYVETPPKPLTPQDWQRIAAAYGLTVAQYRIILASSYTVRGFREQVADARAGGEYERRTAY